MGIRILVAADAEACPDAPGKAALFDSVTNTALECPLFEDADEAEAFVMWWRRQGYMDLRLAEGLDSDVKAFRRYRRRQGLA